MKRPRRPAPRKAVKRATKIERKTLEMTAAQAAVFEAPTPPLQIAYQWAPAADLDDMVDNGWLPVPFARHADVLVRKHNRNGHIVAFDQMLFQREQVLVQAELSLAQRKAVENLQGHEAYREPDRRQGHAFKILSPSFIATRAYDRVAQDAPPLDLDLTIQFRVPASWQDAAAALQLDPAEYARRRLLMEPSVLATTERDRVFEFVEILIARKD